VTAVFHRHTYKGQREIERGEGGLKNKPCPLVWRRWYHSESDQQSRGLWVQSPGKADPNRMDRVYTSIRWSCSCA